MHMQIEHILQYLADRPGSVALLESDGVSVIENGRVKRISEHGAAKMMINSGTSNINAVSDETWRGGGACDISYTWNHWRVINAFRKVSGQLTNEIRLFPKEPPAAAEIGLAGLINEELLEDGGIVVVCGDRRSGRLATLYSMLMDALDGRFAVTIEDPVVFEPEVPQNAVLNRREVGIVGDIPTFAEGIRQAAAQKPHMLLVGKIPDGESARLMVEVACGGSVVMTSQFGNSPEDALSRLLAREAEAVAGNLAQRFGESLLKILKLVVFMTCSRNETLASAEVITGDRLEELKNLFRGYKMGLA